MRSEDQGEEFVGRPDLVKKRGRTILLQRIFTSLVVAYMVITMSLIVVSAYNGTQQRDRLVDCTTPGGKCFEDGQVRQRVAIGVLIKANEDRAGRVEEVVKQAAYCNNFLPMNVPQAQFEKCIKDRLNK